jgi:hypothetical protein
MQSKDRQKQSQRYRGEKTTHASFRMDAIDVLHGNLQAQHECVLGFAIDVA